METLIFYTYEFAASILPFSAAFIFLSAQTEKGRRKNTSSARPAFISFCRLHRMCISRHRNRHLWDAFLYRFQTEISHINPIPFSAGIDMVGYIMNIILFIPFGFLIPLIWKKMRSLHLTALAGFSFPY